ncbi:MAG: metalloregulator ArsR/SmtB family transcription factor [Candidatus Bipolaricaulota bacterium]
MNRKKQRGGLSQRTAQDEWAEVFSCLASPARLLIVEQLMRRPVGCGELQETVGLSQPAMSYHLGKLEHAGILHKTKHGTRNCYQVDARIAHLMAACMKGEESWTTA